GERAGRGRRRHRRLCRTRHPLPPRTPPRATAQRRRVGRPDLLLVAALLHDLGKGWPGDHSVAGETSARDVAGRIGVDTA
ncbi:HD domain-containing protein, partial [Streptomyces lavendulocolor]